MDALDAGFAFGDGAAFIDGKGLEAADRFEEGATLDKNAVTRQGR